VNIPVRTRLTALYGGLFLLAGTALLGITYLLVRQSLDQQPIDRTLVIASVATAPELTEPAAAGYAERVPAISAAESPTGLTADQQAAAVSRLELAQKLQEGFRQETLTSLLQRGGMALLAVGIVGIWLGWLAAGRTLRPLQQITATARRVADRSLHERIGLTGPRDELRELADTFDDMLARLDASFDSQRRFAANASHELRTPLTINRTLLEVALSRPDAPAELRRLGDTLLAVNARHERLIDGLLTLATSDQAVADPAPVDLAQVVRHVTDTVDVSPHIDLRVDTRPSTVPGDPVLLERLTQNLVRNAIAYNTSPGTVSVSCAPVRGGIRLTVTNTGPVIAAYEVAGLFEPFRRLTDRVGSARGSGLGLSIVRSVARAHGGAVTAVPGPRGGLIVTVDLPV
jgi:signal transduction histidine kinase